jgi:hypothetical protein
MLESPKYSGIRLETTSTGPLSLSYWIRATDSTNWMKVEHDEAYIAHACNAYPKLIYMLKLLNDTSRLGSIDMVNDLLKELGE